MADSKISALTDGGSLHAGDALAVARASSSLRVSPIGVPVLVYRYTVTGSDKASIDTGVDTPDAGSNDWTNGDLLEVFFYTKTDDALSGGVNFDCVLNNDASGIYDEEQFFAGNTTLGGATARNRAGWALLSVGGTTASVFASGQLTIPNYAGTVGYKAGIYSAGIGDAMAANNRADLYGLTYRSTSAVTRLKIAPTTSGKKFKVGSQLLIYKRLAS